MTKDITNWKGRKVSFTWIEKINFNKLTNVTQSYGICFDNEGKIVIINTSGHWCLPGGTPEKGETHKQTLIREVLEEADLELGKILPLGYQISKFLDGDKIEKHQLRFIAKIKKVLPQTPDPDKGKIPKRKFITPEKFLEYCPWGNSAENMINSAVKLFDEKLK